MWSARCKEQRRARLRPLPSSVETADQRLAWLTSTFWFAAIPPPGFRKRTSSCSTSCARQSRLGSSERKKPTKHTKDTKVSNRPILAVLHFRVIRVFRGPKRFPAIPTFLATARLRDQVAGARSLSNCRFQISKFCRGWDQSRCKRHPGPPDVWNAFLG